jgi:7,8-dihydropterin-6-yl-methyl-4-(beta-D-ribofuranosyl)aminobenzene 5'-phosphate synthase
MALALLGLLVPGAPSPTEALGQAEKPAEREGSARIRSVDVVVLSTMLADSAGEGEWGFAALVEADGRRVLFDTGARPETVLKNAGELGIDLSGVEEVVLSHHGDHTGGLVTLRRELARRNPKALSLAYVGDGIFLSRPGARGEETNETLAYRKDYEALGGSFRVIDRTTQVFPGAWLTGPVPRVHPERNWSLRRTIVKDGQTVQDNVPEDMSLVLDTEKGLVVVSGCGHAGVINTLEFARKEVRAAPVYVALGGFHLFEADPATLDWTARMLRSCELKHLLGAHCTGIEAVFGLRERLGLDRKTCAVGAVGARFNLQSGLDPGRIAR